MNKLKSLHKVFFVTSFIVAAILFSLAMLSGYFTTVNSQSDFTVEHNTDRRYGDYKNFDLSEAKYELCQDACARDTNCKAYTYVHPWQGASARCWLKDTVNPPESGLTCCITGVKRSSGGGGGSNVRDIDWNSNPSQLGLRGKNNQHFAFKCPPNGESTRIWGTDVYTDDSRICMAAVHAGLITYASGGTVAIEMLPGQNSYTASERYGVTSLNYGGYPGSYRFFR